VKAGPALASVPAPALFTRSVHEREPVLSATSPSQMTMTRRWSFESRGDSITSQGLGESDVPAGAGQVLKSNNRNPNTPPR
jgi:hypothetical protein